MNEKIRFILFPTVFTLMSCLILTGCAGIGYTFVHPLNRDYPGAYNCSEEVGIHQWPPYNDAQASAWIKCMAKHGDSCEFRGDTFLCQRRGRYF